MPIPQYNQCQHHHQQQQHQEQQLHHERKHYSHRKQQKKYCLCRQKHQSQTQLRPQQHHRQHHRHRHHHHHHSQLQYHYSERQNQWRFQHHHYRHFCEFFIILIFSIYAASLQSVVAQTRNDPNQVYVTDSCLEKPYRCPHPKIEFYLYTRRTQDTPELIDVLDDNALYITHFNPRHPTKIIIHGFGGGRNNSPSPDIREAYFTIGDYNIIIVDYSNAVKEPCLSQMDWAPRFGSLCISQLVKYLARHPRGVPPDDLHFIGYSVGAHIAGLVANYIKPEEGKLGRITALDPTIFFYAGANNSRDLDASDANFVDVLHTGAGILGQWHSSGHADFYVNGGTRQPGCAGSSSLFQTLACDHTKVTPYFIESITTRSGFYAGPCANLFTYLIGWCEPKDSEYVLMGEHVSHRARGTYYVTTNAKPPYARGFPGKGRSVGNGGGGGYQGVRR